MPSFSAGVLCFQNPWKTVQGVLCTRVCLSGVPTAKVFCPQGELSKRSPPSWRKESIILGRHPVYFKSVERGKIFVSKTVIFQMTPYCCTVAIP